MADIRPMSFGEIIDGSLKLYRHNFGVFLQLAIAALAVPAALIIYFMMTKAAELPVTMMMAMGGVIDWSIIIYAIVIAVTYGIGNLMLSAAAIRVVSDSYLGRSTTFGQALGTGVSNILPLLLVGFGKYILLGLLGGLIAGGCGFAFMVVSGMAGAPVGGAVAAGIFLLGAWLWLWVYSGYGLTTPIVVLEQLNSSFDAFGRSWDLTKGTRGKVAGLVIVAFLLFSMIPQIVLQVIGQVAGASNPSVLMVFMVLSYVVPLILYPAICCVYTLMYYDLRVRREAFDLQMLSQQLGV
jgi:hypothetical protein